MHYFKKCPHQFRDFHSFSVLTIGQAVTILVIRKSLKCFDVWSLPAFEIHTSLTALLSRDSPVQPSSFQARQFIGLTRNETKAFGNLLCPIVKAYRHTQPKKRISGLFACAHIGAIVPLL